MPTAHTHHLRRWVGFPVPAVLLMLRARPPAGRPAQVTEGGRSWAAVIADIASGDFTGAAAGAFERIAPKVQLPTGMTNVTSGLAGALPAPLTRSLKFAFAKIPVISVGVATFNTGREMKKFSEQGDIPLVATSFALGIVQAAGNFVTFGIAGDLARDALRTGAVHIGGERFAALEKSGIGKITDGVITASENATKFAKAALQLPPPSESHTMTVINTRTGQPLVLSMNSVQENTDHSPEHSHA